MPVPAENLSPRTILDNLEVIGSTTPGRQWRALWDMAEGRVP
jgi:hypothetical protein